MLQVPKKVTPLPSSNRTSTSSSKSLWSLPWKNGTLRCYIKSPRAKSPIWSQLMLPYVISV
jgi:hypothetical protein